MDSDDESNQTAPFPQLSPKDQFDEYNLHQFLFFSLFFDLSSRTNNNDCLTDAFSRIYQLSLWWIALFFKSLHQILLFPKEEFDHDSKDSMHIREILSMNNSADEDNNLEKLHRNLPRYQSSTNQRLSQHKR